MREGVQSIHEPRKLTSWASWCAEWPHSQLPANQNHFRASWYVCQATQLCLSIRYLITKIHQKPFLFEESQHVQSVFYGTLTICVKKSTFMEIKTFLFCFSKFHKFLNLCRTIAALNKERQILYHFISQVYHVRIYLDYHQFTKK